MKKNRPRCPVCAGTMKKNGTTTKGTTRWRCTSPTCGASTTKTRPDRQLSADFNTFIDCICGNASITETAADHNISRRSLERRFNTFWFIDIDHHIDTARIYDQIFIDENLHRCRVPSYRCHTQPRCQLGMGTPGNNRGLPATSRTPTSTCHGGPRWWPRCLLRHQTNLANNPHPTMPSPCPTRRAQTSHLPTTHRCRQNTLQTSPRPHTHNHN